MKTEITIPVSHLKPIISGLAKVINPKHRLPVLSCVRVQTLGDTHLTFTATNLDDFAQARISASSVFQPFDALIPFDQLSKLTKGSSLQDRFTFIHDDAEQSLKLRHTVGGTALEQHLPYFPASDFPPLPVIDSSQGTTADYAFKQALLQAFEAASNDQGRFILNHAFIDVAEPNSHYIVGTDGKQLFSANSFQLALKESFLCPRRKFLLWNGFLENGDWMIQLGRQSKDPTGTTWIRIDSESWKFFTKGVEGTYPKWKQVVPGEDRVQTVVTFSPEAVELTSLAVPRLPGRDEINSGVKLLFTRSGSLILQGKTEKDEARVPITGALVEHLPGGKPMEAVALNSQLLLKALRSGLTTLEVIDPTTPLVFRKEGKRLVVAPLVCAPEPRETSEPEETGTKEEGTSIATSIPEVKADPASPLTQNPTIPEQPEPNIQTSTTTEEEQNIMKTTNRIVEMQSPPTPVLPSSSTAAGNTERQEPVTSASALLQARDQIEKMKDTFRSALVDLNDASKLLLQAAREKKATEREIESVRSTLRSLQKVQL